MHQIETYTIGDFMPHTAKRYKNLSPEWQNFKPGCLVTQADNEEITYKYIEHYTERDGSAAILCHDSTGTRRYFTPDSVRLVSLTGRGKSRGRRGESLLSDAESKLSRAEKRKLRRERRETSEPIHADGID